MKSFLSIVIYISAGLPVLAAEPPSPLGIEQVKAKYEAKLLDFPGVESVGIGQDANGNPTIEIELEEDRPELMQALPRNLDGYPVRLKVIVVPAAPQQEPGAAP